MKETYPTEIRETAKKISDNTKNKIKEIEWKKIVGLRNLISHEYEGISPAILYSILTIEIPKLANHLSNAIGSMADED
jgi:uncharacterized protein with HEPN domain